MVISEPTLSLTAAVRSSLEGTTTTVGVATGLVEAGRSIDLSGLDVMAGRLCAQVLDLPPELGVQFRSALLELSERLSALQTAVATRVDG